jgi:hypothetical protein
MIPFLILPFIVPLISIIVPLISIPVNSAFFDLGAIYLQSLLPWMGAFNASITLSIAQLDFELLKIV